MSAPATPVVIQGTPVANPNVAQPPRTGGFGSALNTSAATDGLAASDKRETKCNDAWAALLFYGCLVAVIALAVVYGPGALDVNQGNSNFDYTGYVLAAVVITIISFFGAGAGLMVMMCIPQFLIKVSLISVVVMSGVWAIMSFASGGIGMGVVGLIFFAISVCCTFRCKDWKEIRESSGLILVSFVFSSSHTTNPFHHLFCFSLFLTDAYAVWSRIPFATINLITACTAIKSNLGVAGKVPFD
jgi:hypothetical protein